MALEGDGLVSPAAEVPMIEGDVVSAIRTLAARGIGKKVIAREIGVAINTVRRLCRVLRLMYLRGRQPGEGAGLLRWTSGLRSEAAVQQSVIVESGKFPVFPVSVRIQ